MDLGLEGRIALVCGASRGIGRETALRLAREGADVAVLGRSTDRLEAVAGEIRSLGRRAHAAAVDVSDRPALREALELAAAELGAPTILVLGVAEVYQHQKLQFVDDETQDRLLDVDLRAALDVARWALPHMMLARYGRVVALSSLAARASIPGGTIYGATKAALEGMIRGIALDYGRRGITANALAIGFSETERLAGRLEGHDEVRAKLERATALHRLARPEEIADVCVFLCSARAGAITGAVIDVTCGSHLATLF